MLLRLRLPLLLTTIALALVAFGGTAFAIGQTDVSAALVSAPTDPDGNDIATYTFTIANAGASPTSNLNFLLGHTGAVPAITTFQVTPAGGPAATFNCVAADATSDECNSNTETVIPSGTSATLVVHVPYSGAGAAMLSVNAGIDNAAPGTSGNDTASSTLTVAAAANDVPVCPIEPTVTLEHPHTDPASSFATPVPATCTDIDAGDSLSLVTSTAPAHGAVTFTGGTTIQWTPTNDYRGLDDFAVSVSDVAGATAPLQTVHVHRYEAAELDYQLAAPATAEAQLPYVVTARIANNGIETATRSEVTVTLPDSFAVSASSGGTTCAKTGSVAGTSTFACLPGSVSAGSVLATTFTFVPASAAVGVPATVTAIGLSGSANTAVTNGSASTGLVQQVVVTAPSLVATVLPTIEGGGNVGVALRCTNATFNRTPTSTSVQWLVNGVVDPARTEYVTTFGTSYLGKSIACRITATYGSLVGSGTSTPVVAAFGRYFVGSSLKDRYIGTKLGDIASGGGGNDTLLCGAGNDICSGGAGNDVVDCGVGNDSCRGEVGNDTVRCGAGNDTCHGDNGNDTVTCGAGTDKCYGDAGNDSVNAKDGKGGDTIDGGKGKDTCTGDRKDKYKNCEKVVRGKK